MSDFASKVRSIAAPRRLGQSEKVRVVNQDDGSTAGIETKHWDGSQDAVAMPKAINLKVGMSPGGEA